MAKGCWFISGHRALIISVADQQGHDGSAEACWDMKGYPTVPCTKATAGEQMVWCLSEKVRAIWATASNSEWMIKFIHLCDMGKRQMWISFTVCWGWPQVVTLCFNILYLLLMLPWAGVRLNHSSCVYSVFLRLQNPTERQKEGKTNEGDGKRAVRTPAYDSENWTTWRWEGENESPSSLLQSLHHLGPLQVGTCGCSIGDLLFFSYPPKPL